MKNEKDIKKFPITYSQRRKNILGPLQVECQVSGRFLRFHKNSSLLQGGEFITIDVMTSQSEDLSEAKKICEMIITREDLLDALRYINPET